MTSSQPFPISRLQAERIAALSVGNGAAVAIRTVASTGSTNADLLGEIQAAIQAAAAGEPASMMRPTLLAAQMQTAGRGRAGRVWHSEPDAALTFSLAWKFDRPLQHLAGLPLAVGATLAEALASLGQAVQLKWPNDVLLDGAKVAGILIETVSDRQAGAETTWAVIGIGLNLALPQAALRRFNSANATALLKVEREQVLAAVLDHLCATLRSFERDGFTVFAERWNAYHAYAGQAVKILDQGRVLHQGVAVGVDQAGRLLLNTDDGPVAVAAGDVSLRLLGATAA